MMMLEELSFVGRIFLAMLLGGIIGSEREKNRRPAGFRTHILVCVGACMTSLVGMQLFNTLGEVTDPARIPAQVISGIGFLGVGTILVKEHDHITGLTTAAGLWVTAVIGVAAGFGCYMTAIAGTAAVTLTSAILGKRENPNRRRKRCRTVYLELRGTECLNEYTDWMIRELGAENITVHPPKSAACGHVGISFCPAFSEAEEISSVLERIRKKEKVVFAIEIQPGEP